MTLLGWLELVDTGLWLELVYTPDSKSGAERREGSNPSGPTEC